MSAEGELIEQVRALARLQGVDLDANRAAVLAARYPEYQAALELLRSQSLGQSEPALEFNPLSPSS